MEQLQQGQTDALDELYARYAGKLYAFCSYTMRVQHHEEVEDLVQDVFVRAIRSAHTYNPRWASLRTWLFRIARNLCIDRARRDKVLRIVRLGEHQGHGAREADDRFDRVPTWPGRARYTGLLSRLASDRVGVAGAGPDASGPRGSVRTRAV